jgi:methionyl-tRNA formyltransferase
MDYRDAPCKDGDSGWGANADRFREASVKIEHTADTQIRVVTFGSDHPFTRPAVKLVESLDGFIHVGHVRTFDEREFLRSPNSLESREFLHSLSPDLFLSSGYGRILADETLGIATIGSINVHPSLLPRFRGRATVAWALYEGATEVGLTIHEMVSSVDSGAVLAQHAVPVGGRTDATLIYRELAAVLPPILEDVLLEIRDTGKISGTPQAVEGASYRDFPSREAKRLEVDWRLASREIIRRADVFSGQSNTHIGRWRVFFQRLEHVSQEVEHVSRQPGTIVRRRPRSIDVIAGDGNRVRVTFQRPLRAWLKLGLSATNSLPLPDLHDHNGVGLSETLEDAPRGHRSASRTV